MLDSPTDLANECTLKSWGLSIGITIKPHSDSVLAIALILFMNMLHNSMVGMLCSFKKGLLLMKTSINPHITVKQSHE